MTYRGGIVSDTVKSLFKTVTYNCGKFYTSKQKDVHLTVVYIYNLVDMATKETNHPSFGLK